MYGVYFRDWRPNLLREDYSVVMMTDPKLSDWGDLRRARAEIEGAREALREEGIHGLVQWAAPEGLFRTVKYLAVKNEDVPLALLILGDENYI